MINVPGEGSIEDVVPMRSASQAVSLGMQKNFGKEFGQSLLLAAGCGLGVIGGGFGPIVGAAPVSSEQEAEELCRELDTQLKVVGADSEAGAVNWLALVWQLLQWWMSNPRT